MNLLGVEGQALAKEPESAGQICIKRAMSCPFPEPKPPQQGYVAAEGALPLLSASPALTPWQGLQGAEHHRFPQSCQQVQELLSLVP